MKLLDHYPGFRRAFHTCKCGWFGTVAMITNGKDTDLGIDKHWPECGEHHSFAKFSVLVGDDRRDIG